MALATCLIFLLLASVLCADTCGASVPLCKANWFGSPCRYECHCVNNACDENGECSETSECENGWFGPSCQYVDLVAANTTATTPAWVYDYPDTLCNTGQDMVTVSLDGTFYFTWLRLRVNYAVSPQDFTFQLMDAYGTAVECSNMYTSSVSDTLVDMHCQQGAFFQALIITGAGVRSLCSVYISGGRNVALGQNTTQTSEYQNKGSWLAVDGDSNSEFLHGSCSHTDVTDMTPTWKLTFEWPHHVNRYVLYNRNANQDRLWGFILEAIQESGSVAFTFTDSTNTSHSIYQIQSNTPQIPITGVNIFATHKSINEYILTLCETEMFGDTVCPKERYGRDCNKRCNCANSGDSCFVSTGGCPSGCAAGYQGEACQTLCSKTYFGVNCLQKCSTNCTDELCEANNGSCLSCIPGKQGPLCDEACSKTYFGDNCLQKCSTNCTDELCEATNGTCLSCIPGKQGSLCDEACSKKYFGVNCLHKCSTNCMDELCEATNGTCLFCIPGKQGSLCDEALPVHGPEKCISVPVIVGLVIAVIVVQDTLIVIGVLIWRRLKHKTEETRQTTPHRDHKYSEADSVRTLELNTVTTKPDKDVTGQENSPDHPYEIPTNPTAQTQKARQLKSEDDVTYVNATMATANDSFDDTMANTYVDIHDL